MKTIFKKTGLVSWFGGPADTGLTAIEGLALVEPKEVRSECFEDYFLPTLSLKKGLARQLDPTRYFCAMRWDYSLTTRKQLQRAWVLVTSENGGEAWCRPVDWGPALHTKRIIDVSQGAMRALKVKTDDQVTCTLFI